MAALICALRFHLNSLSFLVLLLWWALPASSFGAPWHFSKKLAALLPPPSESSSRIDISSPQELQDLLTDLSYLREFSSLQASFQAGEWEIEGEVAPLIAEISFRYQESELYELTTLIRQKYLGEISSAEIHKQLSDELSQQVSTRGYLNNRVSVTSSSAGINAQLVVTIESGEPCTLREIKSSFVLPPEVHFGVHVGDKCSNEEIRRAFENLGEQLIKNNYLDARLSQKPLVYSADNTKATIVIEGSLPRKILYKVINSERSTADTLFHLNGELSGIDYSSADPEEFARSLRKRYYSAGFFDFEITSLKKIEDAQGNLTYQVRIAPGQEYSVTKITFAGDATFSQKELEKTIDLTNLLGDFASFSQERIDTGISKLVQLYQQHGFWDAEINATIIEQRPQTGSVGLLVKISAKKQRIFRSLHLSGNREVSAEALQALASFHELEAITKEQLFTFEDAIKSHYSSLGFNDAAVSWEITPFSERTSEFIEVAVTIHEGVRERIGKIKFVGLEKTKKEVVTRELVFQSGEWYDINKINQSRAALLRLGIFSEVRINPLRTPFRNPQPGASNESAIKDVDVIIEVKEGSAGNVVFGPGYDLVRGISYMTQISYNNLFGTGRRISLRGALSQERSQYAVTEVGDKEGSVFLGRKFGLGFLEPYVFGLPADGAINFTYQATADRIRQYNKIADISLTYTPSFLPGRNSVTPFLNFQVNKEEGTRDQEQSLIVTPGSKIARAGIRLKTDQRNQVDWPTSGFLSKLTLAKASFLLPSDYEFFQWSFTHNFYLAPTERLVWVNGISLAAYEDIKSTSDNNLPDSERLFAGGSTYVRGFKEQPGPYVLNQEKKGDPLGGSKRLVAKSELRYKFSDKWGGAFFVDAGNSFYSLEEIQLIRERLISNNQDHSTYSIEDNFNYAFRDLLSNPRYLYSKNFLSFGFSASLITPLGPFFFSLAWPWREPQSENCRDNKVCYPRGNGPVFYVTIGTEF